MLLMPKEMIIALTIIFGLFVLMIIRTAWLLRQEKLKIIEDKLKSEYMSYVAHGNEPKWEYKYWKLLQEKKEKGGKRMKHKHYNGRFFW